MANIRVRDMAEQMNIPSKDLIFKLQSLGVEIDTENDVLDRSTIIAVLSGKRVAQRQRPVIMRDERVSAKRATPESKTKKVEPPRPIVKPPRAIKPKQQAPSASSPQGPVIQEFIDAAEEEAKEQERIAKEAKEQKKATPAVKKRAIKKVVAKPAAEPAVEETKSAEEANREKADERKKSDDLNRLVTRKIGPSGPRARVVATPRPDYGDQKRAASVRRPAASTDPRSRGPATGRPATGRPATGRPGAGRPQIDPNMTPPPEQPTTRRRRTAPTGGTPERKKTSHEARRRRASAAARDRDESYFHKGPFSARAVLEDDPAEPIQHTPSARKDKRKQAKPTANVFEFQKPEETILLSEGVTVKDLAEKLEVKASDLITHLIKKGRMITMNSPLGQDLAMEIAGDLGIDADFVSYEDALVIEDLEKEAELDDGAETELRAPVITVMGHVDHGKTSLLDAIREAKVAEGEAGGITQHIGAYSVVKNGQRIVFLDTPGHEAFTLMRARGAKVTDIVILVVAADDGVMPQTKEAINHAQAAGVPLIVAINKIDKPNANVDRVKQELSQNGVLVESWGGEIVSVEVSALKKQGIDDLLEMISINAEILELRAAPSRRAKGIVLEARKDTGRGNVATVLVQDGSLAIGDYFVAGSTTGRVRAMIDDRGSRIKNVGPATPISIMGFDDIPEAGDSFIGVVDASEARDITETRKEKEQAKEAAKKGSRMSLDSLFAKLQEGDVKELNVIAKADVQGSVEVLRDTLEKLSREEVKVNVIHAAVGAVSTNDVLLASASDAVIVGFSVRPEKAATDLAKAEKVDIRLHTVIYELIDEIKQAMAGLLDPISEEVVKGRAEVRDLFKVPRAGTIAGCHVTDGVIPRSASARLLRDNRVIHEGPIGSLRHFKDDVSEVRQGFECGIGFDRFQDIKPGDVIEAYVVEEHAATLD